MRPALAIALLLTACDPPDPSSMPAGAACSPSPTSLQISYGTTGVAGATPTGTVLTIDDLGAQVFHAWDSQGDRYCCFTAGDDIAGLVRDATDADLIDVPPAGKPCGAGAVKQKFLSLQLGTRFVRYACDQLTATAAASPAFASAFAGVSGQLDALASQCP